MAIVDFNKNSIGGGGSGGGSGSDPNAVKYTEQSLTEAQKEQARTNIGAYSKPASGIPASDLASGVIPTQVELTTTIINNLWNNA